MDERVCDVYRTYDYNKFRDLRGNRDDAEKRAKKIIASIKEVGFVINPIIVNNKMEIIDGQARFTALKELGYPIYYIIDDEIGFKECIAMNSNQTNWKFADYVSGYANVGNDDYIRFQLLCDSYLKDFGISTILNAATRLFRNYSSVIRGGKLACSHEQFIHAKDLLEYDRKVKPYIDAVCGGTKEYYYHAIHFCFESDSVDNDVLLNKLKINYASLPPIANVYQALESIEKIYNTRNRNPVFIVTEYKTTALKNKQQSWKKREKR